MQTPSVRRCTMVQFCYPLFHPLTCAREVEDTQETGLISWVCPHSASRFPLGLLTREVPRPDIRFKYQDVEPTSSVPPVSPSILNTRFEVKEERTFSCPASSGAIKTRFEFNGERTLSCPVSPFVFDTALRSMTKGFPVAVVQGSRTFSRLGSSGALETALSSRVREPSAALVQGSMILRLFRSSHLRLKRASKQPRPLLE